MEPMPLPFPFLPRLARPCLLSILLAGCAVGPDFHRPSIDAPSRVSEQPIAQRTASAKIGGGEAQTLSAGADLPGQWWTLFGSRALTALVATAMRDSPTIEAADAALRQAQEKTLQQTGTLFPSISGTISRTRSEQPEAYLGIPGPAPTISAYSAQLNLSYTLDIWGGLRRAIEQQQAGANYQRFQLEQAYLTLTSGVAASAVQAASLAGQIAVQKALIGFEQKQLDTVHAQFEAGGATGTDLATQQAQLAQAQTILVPLLTELAQTRDQLAAYLGRAPSQAALPDFDLDDFTLPETVPVSVPSALLAQRPDIRAAEALLHQQTAALGVAIAARLPNVTLTAGVGTTAADVHQMFSPTNGMWSLVNQAVQPIFDAGQLLHAQRAQRAAMEQAAAQWRQTVVAAFQNVADVLAALQNDAVGLRAALAAADAAQRGLSLASLQFKLGGVSYLSVLTAQQTYQTASLTLIRARAARYADTIALFAALGGGWWNRHDMPPPPPGLLSSPLP